jgi:hypothetical protein
MKYIALFIILTSCAFAQLQPASPREFIYDGRIYARSVDADSVVLLNIPARTAITRIYVMPEDSTWMLSASVILATQYGEIMTYTTEDAGVDDCYGCLAADWPQTWGDVLYSKNARTLVARLTGWTGDARGTLRIIVYLSELF